jgi:hypothetical protein
MSAARVAELRRLVAEAETNAGVEALIAAARDIVTAWCDLGCFWDSLDDLPIKVHRVDAAIDRLEELVGRPR